MSMSVRQEKAASLWSKLLAQILIEEGDIRGVAWSISAVIPSPDLKTARVMISAIGSEADQLVKSLNDRKSNFSRLLAARIASKFSPRLDFVRDLTEDKAGEVEQIIAQL